MASLSSAKTLGGIGGILVFLPGLSLVGWILILVSLNEISNVVHDRSVFDDALIAGITAILGSVALLVFLVSGAFSTLVAFGALTFGTGGVLAAVGTLAFFWVFAIVSAIFLKRAYDKTVQRLNVHAFATAGLLYLIGAVTAPTAQQPPLHLNRPKSSSSVTSAARKFLATPSFVPAVAQNSRSLRTPFPRTLTPKVVPRQIGALTVYRITRTVTGRPYSSLAGSSS